MSKYDNKLRNKIYERDNFLCRVCGRQAGNIHHIVYRSHAGSNSEKNLIAICMYCHTKVHNNEKKWVSILITMQEEIYGHIDKEDLKKKSKYYNMKFGGK